MFRTISTLLLASFLPVAILPAVALNADQAMTARPLPIDDAHLLSQLDWRSYYLNRFAASHDSRSSGLKAWRQAPAGLSAPALGER